MDVMAATNSFTTGTTAINTGGGLSIVPSTKIPETESVTPPRIHTNGVLKRHKHHHVLVGCEFSYKECLKNHAASLGGHALDGCGEFMPAQTATVTDPRSLKCAACGCHRNFHRRDKVLGGGTRVIEYHPQHRHHPLPPTAATLSPASDDQSPPPISSTYYPGSAPHMLLALSSGGGTTADENAKIETTTPTTAVANPAHVFSSASPHLPSRKRFRTKFSQEQKERMQEFAEKVGWKMQKSTEDMVIGFCNEIGVQREVFKVWMHNNKNTSGRRSATNNNQAGISITDINNPVKEDYEHVNGNGNGNGVGNSHSSSISDHHHHQQFHDGRNHQSTNASSSSS